MRREIEPVLRTLAWMRDRRLWPNGLRYLWTDAFGVVLLVSLRDELGDDRYLEEAEWVVAEVERVLGRARGIRIGEQPDRDGLPGRPGRDRDKRRSSPASREGAHLMTVAEQIVRLAKLKASSDAVVSVYLNVWWADEQQRERARLFLKHEIQKARHPDASDSLAAALDWIAAQGNALIDQVRHPAARGVAIFTCPAQNLGEVVTVRVPFENTFIVADRPFLRPLAAALDQAPVALVVFVDAESARLIPVSVEGAGDEVRLDSEVPGHHRRGGWAQLAQSRYQRHIEERRKCHLEAVAEALGRLVKEHGVERLVIAGSPDNTAALRRVLSPRASERIAGTVPGTRHEPASQLVARAADVIDRRGAIDTGAAVDAVLTEAAKGGHAVAGLDEVLEAVQRGAVDRLYLLHGFRSGGGACDECAALQPGDGAACRLCGHPTHAMELGEAMVDRVLAAGGAVTTVEGREDLARVGGVAARLRFPL